MSVCLSICLSVYLSVQPDLKNSDEFFMPGAFKKRQKTIFLASKLGIWQRWIDGKEDFCPPCILYQSGEAKINILSYGFDFTIIEKEIL